MLTKVEQEKFIESEIINLINFLSDAKEMLNIILKKNQDTYELLMQPYLTLDKKNNEVSKNMIQVNKAILDRCMKGLEAVQYQIEFDKDKLENLRWQLVKKNPNQFHLDYGLLLNNIFKNLSIKAVRGFLPSQQNNYHSKRAHAFEPTKNYFYHILITKLFQQLERNSFLFQNMPSDIKEKIFLYILSEQSLNNQQIPKAIFANRNIFFKENNMNNRLGFTNEEIDNHGYGALQ